MRLRPLLPLLLLLIALPAGAMAPVAEPSGYREGEYTAPVPSSLAGATVVSTATAHALWQAGQTAFIDVLPRAARPEKLPAGTLWHEKPRLSIPAALWLPNVGYGRLAAVMQRYFRAGLEKATAADKHHPVLFFCLDDCWMSWNAARRALEYGYTHVLWYPQGTDGWTAANHPTQPLAPEPGGQ